MQKNTENKQRRVTEERINRLNDYMTKLNARTLTGHYMVRGPQRAHLRAKAFHVRNMMRKDKPKLLGLSPRSRLSFFQSKKS